MPMNDASPFKSANLRRSLSAAVAAGVVALAVFGCSGGYDSVPLPEGEPLAQGDADCQADNEPSQGDVCTQDCLTATCASGMGRRICTCSGGVFLQCACMPPANWPFKDVPAAPYCDHTTGQPKYLSGERCTEGQECRSADFPEQGCHCIGEIWQCGSSDDVSEGAPSCEPFGNGLQAVLDGQPCDTEWQLCVSRDFNPTGTSPRGCACMKDGAQLLWSCGATNRWWRAE
jgi:hypothetical protein